MKGMGKCVGMWEEVRGNVGRCVRGGVEKFVWSVGRDRGSALGSGEMWGSMMWGSMEGVWKCV